jgi:hypothetical protein
MSTFSKTAGVHQRNSELGSKMGLSLGFIVSGWFLSALILGWHRAFVRPAGSLPVPILLSIAVPVTVFFSAYRSSNRFRNWILSADLNLITGVQAWRFGGFVFLVLYGLNLLPGYFAWPAGLGDMAIAAAAPFIVGSLIRNPQFINSKLFLVWNVLGILDLVIAVTLGGLGPIFFHNATTPTALMARLPMSLIPTFFVPMFILLHLTALFQRRK